jgi:prevent-host-death family protein
MCVIMSNMKSASVREIQHHFRKVLAWVENGEEVLVTRRNKTIARLVPSTSTALSVVPLPDFAARSHAIWGKRPKGRSLSAEIIADRDDR